MHPGGGGGVEGPGTLQRRGFARERKTRFNSINKFFNHLLNFIEFGITMFLTRLPSRLDPKCATEEEFEN